MISPAQELSKRAMLVHLKISKWTGRTKDRNVTQEVQTAKSAEADSGAWWTYLIPAKTLRPIVTACSRCRCEHHRLTLPWMDGGLRILPAAMFMHYTKVMREVINEYNDAVDIFLKDYPQIVASAQKRLGKLLQGKRFPSVQEIKYKYGIHQDVLPMPSTSDFRVKMSEEQVKEIRKQINDSIEEMTAKAMADLWQRFIELVEKVEETLGKPDKIFRDSLISNLQEFCELIPKLNVSNDKELENIRKEATERLASLKPDNLRNSKHERKAAHKVAADVLGKMKAYVK